MKQMKSEIWGGITIIVVAFLVGILITWMVMRTTPANAQEISASAEVSTEAIAPVPDLPVIGDIDDSVSNCQGECPATPEETPDAPRRSSSGGSSRTRCQWNPEIGARNVLCVAPAPVVPTWTDEQFALLIKVLIALGII